MPRLGVVGTLVWDSIHGPEGGDPHRDWGGIAYSLAAWGAVAPPGWTAVPIVKVGADLADDARGFLSGLRGLDTDEFVATVPEANNRVDLFYHDRSRRCERLTGGVPGWDAGELSRAALSCDAIYVNFISGWELDRSAAAYLGSRFEGPRWCDVHSLILGVGEDGMREPRPLPDRSAWLAAFDLVQVNEDELRVLSAVKGETRDRAEDLLTDGPDGVFVTLGTDGAEWAMAPEAPWLMGDVGARTGRIAVERVARDGATDPTGCGDVWGISCFASLLGGAPIGEAVGRANRLAAATAARSGTAGLAERLADATGAGHEEIIEAE